MNDFDIKDLLLELETMQIISHDKSSIVIPLQTPLNIKKRLLHAISNAKSEADPFYDFDTYLSPHREVLQVAIVVARSQVNYVRDIHHDITFTPTTRINLISFLALSKLSETFHLCCSLLWVGFNTEAMSLLRQIVEQLAWCLSIENVHGEDFLKHKPQSQISKLKSWFPESGKLYGHLSKFAHIEPAVVSEYWHVIGDTISIKEEDFKRTQDNICILLQLADYYEVIMEYILSPERMDFKVLKKYKGQYGPKKNRSFQKDIQAVIVGFEHVEKQYSTIPVTKPISSAIQSQQTSFKEKFGFEPRPNDPVFFDPQKDFPAPLPMEEFEKAKEVFISIMKKLNVEPEYIYGYEKTDLLASYHNWDRLPDRDKRMWQNAIEEYAHITKTKKKSLRMVLKRTDKILDKVMELMMPTEKSS